jgi:hypothetical protein
MTDESKPENTPQNESANHPTPQEQTPLPPEKEQADQQPAPKATNLADDSDAAEAVGEWEAEDTSEAGKARSKGALIALAAVVVLLAVAIIVSAMRDDRKLPPGWEKPDGVTVQASQVEYADENMIEYYRLEWPGDAQAVLSETLEMLSDAPAPDAAAPQVVNEELRKHRTDQMPGKQIPAPDGLSEGLFYSYTRAPGAIDQPYQGDVPKRDIYIWPQNGTCLVEIFSY